MRVAKTEMLKCMTDNTLKRLNKNKKYMAQVSVTTIKDKMRLTENYLVMHKASP